LRAATPAAAALAAALLAACGGHDTPPRDEPASSSDGNGQPLDPAAGSSLAPLVSAPTAQTYAFVQAKSDEEAARFLLQAQAYANEADIAAVRSMGYLPWLGQQMDLSPAPTGWAWIASKDYNAASIDDLIWKELMSAPDPVRKRMALVLSEIFVVSANEVSSAWTGLMLAQYWDTLVAGVTGNFRKLLEDITLNPAMGLYLNTRGNKKEDAQGRQPDENYAREIMQLMTIGLVQLNPDGTQKLAADGTPLPTYTQSDVMNLARVFTGYDLDIRPGEYHRFSPPGANFDIESSDWTQRPMALVAEHHSLLEARFLGAVVPAGAAASTALKIALDTLFNHPNVGPFIGKQLIQRLVTSNPSPAYVKRVADVFADNGAGVRGDMKSVLAAVLLDNEARSPAGLTDESFGRLREPMLRLAQWGRTFGARSASDSWKIGNTSDAAGQLGQSPLRSPSVFNFFRPGYVPPSTDIAARKLVAPEFQIVNETSVAGYLNFMQLAVQRGFNEKDVMATYAAEKAIVLDATALVARLNLLLTANQLSSTTVKLITWALAATPLDASTSEAARMNRIYAAVLMVLAAPEYLVQK
ncbi:MAG: DUF1800 domain-containing protein, partial [Gammaproteobacteria bacterium]|nr:DUF1800 domain-containing protein [Gammaproteobacteria bacterium]